MTEAENPLIHIAGTVSEKDIKAAIRTMGLRAFWKISVIYLGAIVLMFTAMFLYEWYTSEINLYYTFGEWQVISWNAIFGNPTFLCVYWLYGIGSAVSADPKAKPCRETAARTLAGEEAAHVMALLKERCPQRKTV